MGSKTDAISVDCFVNNRKMITLDNCLQYMPKMAVKSDSMLLSCCLCVLQSNTPCRFTGGSTFQSICH